MMFETLLNDCQTAFPVLGWALIGLTVLALNLFWRSAWVAFGTSILGLVFLILFSSIRLYSGAPVEAFQHALKFDSTFEIFNLIGLVLHLGVVFMLVPGIDKKTRVFQSSYEQLPELLICLLFAGFGFSVLCAASDLSALFLGLETLSIGVYCLCGFYRTEIRSTESAFKYLMIGAFSTVLFLYGLAFLYGATGSTSFSEIQSSLNISSPFVVLAVVFLVSAFAFKLAFVPFHLYTPDVYEGAPTPITAYLSTVIKVGVIAAATRVFWQVLGSAAGIWQSFWLALCILSILVGNIFALQQRSLKKLLAFSSISHSGFIGLALLTMGSAQGDYYPLVAYLVVYSAISLGLFSLISLLEDRDRVLMVDDLKGLGQKKFALALVISVFVMGLAGLPPFAGFMVKFWVLEALIKQDLVAVSIVAIVGSLIGAAYYLRILMLMFMSDEAGAAAEGVLMKDRLFLARLVVVLASLLTLLGGIRPQIYADWILTTLALK